jgi:hypothetical protein|tara:strand:- start:19970 stop:20239 length:270 start_codon:yes stop_codon:yes gene_type:complete
MKPLPQQNDGSYDQTILAKGQEYTVGTNDGCCFKDVVYKGTKLYNGKHIMVFQTQNKQQLTINPSYHSYTLESPEIFYLNAENQTHKEK